ncbi:four-carbon acid sugar kinase family protein [Dyadobacter sp. CY261]|uniref:four-carbon acid sugar kinase family protein n=1 Tax=Dyadobacter sp. CY261 TaxID=2907203 RepID=UPI001F421478|nr:four-carbon acid sugar kinase family protein [Dyadobacter sp. CY261]MCF0073960.1 four-carbon acid sugar kinase family protein [Dyadobacter sp. CY261]
MSDLNILLAFYGDDFTGSTDTMEILERAGIRTALFIDPPGPEDLARFPDIQAFGIAGMTRAMAPAQMEEALRPAFERLRRSGARHIHYKVCSTFDSSPTIGSIGKAIDVGAEIFRSDFISLVVAAPPLGRYCAFGNLFARMGIGSDGQIHRLDRHPSMSKHPTTPADESDLRMHLAKQTKKSCGLIDILQIQGDQNIALAALQNCVQNNDIVLFDALYDHQMRTIGELIDRFGTPDKPHFSVGSSGIEMALTGFWKDQGIIQPPAAWPEPGEASPLLVLSGSCSPVTARQIDYALANGFEEIALDTPAIAAGTHDQTFADDIERGIQSIRKGKSVIIHTSKSTQDDRFVQSHQILKRNGLNATDIQSITATLYGGALGTIAREIASTTNLHRIVIAGGDTSGIVARALGIKAVSMMTPLSPGAPLCLAFAPGAAVDGSEVVFKGGQVGGEEYFEVVRLGKF